jgi:hypothetical protein
MVRGIELQSQLDIICEKIGIWPHALLSGHAHNYQRFPRTSQNGTQIPHTICSNGGHDVKRLSKTTGGLRTPQIIQKAHVEIDQLALENLRRSGLRLFAGRR